MLKKLEKVGQAIKEKAKYVSLTTMMLITTTTVPVYASDNKYATNVSNWMLDGIQSLVLVAAAGVVGMYVIKRKFVQMLVALVVAGIIIAIVYNPTMLKTIGDYLVGVIFG